MEDRTVEKANKRATNNGRYIYTKVLGRGSFGKVLKAMDLSDGKTVAIKILDCNGWKKNGRREAATLKNLQHDNITRIKDDFEFQKWRILPKGIAIVMEFCSGGSLSEFLKNLMQRDTVLSEEKRLMWYKQVISALAYIHEKSTIHRDIKPENILVDRGENLKLADVGLAKIVHEEQELEKNTASLYMKTMCGTYPYMAPEVFQNHYTNKSDIFSMGLVMLVICELPKNLIIQVKGNFIEHSCLGHYYFRIFEKHQEPQEAINLVATNNCLADEKKMFNLMLHPNYHNRPSSATVKERLDTIERERQEEKMRQLRLQQEAEERERERERQRQEDIRRQQEAESQSSCILL